jgi:hypothetical protein
MATHVLKWRKVGRVGGKTLAAVLVIIMAVAIIRDILARRPAPDYGPESNVGLPAE